MKAFKTSKLGVRPNTTIIDLTRGKVYPILKINGDFEDEIVVVIVNDIGEQHSFSDWYIDEHFDWVVLP